MQYLSHKAVYIAYILQENQLNNSRVNTNVQRMHRKSLKVDPKTVYQCFHIKNTDILQFKFQNNSSFLMHPIKPTRQIDIHVVFWYYKTKVGNPYHISSWNGFSNVIL
uniref:Uncharacterized protein n=1 Tax=Arundo donax TaxID=35708 RepID=A0A0A9CEU1_ARUDO